ncbi:MAG: hypothetical protein FWH04_00155 [Oscillospiraceae bacterium]|nr:hypothetical protein [Oscillospiraceae bacterium]
MKKKSFIVCLVAALMVFAMLPAQASAASKHEKALNKLKFSGVSKYDTKLPSNGKKQSNKQFQKAYSKAIKNTKQSKKGNTWYGTSLHFNKQKDAESGEWVISSASKSKYWSKIANGKDFHASRGESTQLKDWNGKLNQKPQLYISTEDKKYYHNYGWQKKSKKGSHTRSRKKKAASGDNNNAGTGTGKTKRSNYIIYKDQKVLGQKCFVYSYVETYTSKSGNTTNTTTNTHYIWQSRKTGSQIKSVDVNDNGNYTSTSISFTQKRVNKKASFYKVPKSVKFKRTTYS